MINILKFEVTFFNLSQNAIEWSIIASGNPKFFALGPVKLFKWNLSFPLPPPKGRPPCNYLCLQHLSTPAERGGSSLAMGEVQNSPRESDILCESPTYDYNRFIGQKPAPAPNLGYSPQSRRRSPSLLNCRRGLTRSNALEASSLLTPRGCYCSCFYPRCMPTTQTMYRLQQVTLSPLRTSRTQTHSASTSSATSRSSGATTRRRCAGRRRRDIANLCKRRWNKLSNQSLLVRQSPSSNKQFLPS